MTSPGHPLRKIVIIAPYLPFDGIDHGGGQYLQQLHRSLRTRTHVTFIVPGYVSSDQGRPGSPDEVLVLTSLDAATGVHRGALRLAGWVWGLAGRIDGNLPDLPFFLDLVLSRPARRAISRADVVDLQWPHYVRMAPLVRSLNGRARIILTMHDVASQRFERRALSSSEAYSRARYSLMAWLARAGEKRALRHGHGVVFSQKDADLLQRSGRSTSITVVSLPLASGAALPRLAPRSPREVLFVGALDRPENADAVAWFVARIWPTVLTCCGGARLVVVGRGANPELQHLVDGRSDIVLAGFVADLAGQYAHASACVVPLRQGAGVKVKTVEALLAGVPTVSTPVGAEGIGEDYLFCGVTDDPDEFAARLLWVLRHASEAEDISRRAQTWATKIHGAESFARAVESVYFMDTNLVTDSGQ